jgi:predicted DNA-binding transcriptional regulator AlpA
MSIEEHPQTPNATTEPAELELWDRAFVLRFFGGSRPLHVSTLYRGVRSGLYPQPVNVAPNTVRWLGHECRAARQDRVP